VLSAIQSPGEKLQRLEVLERVIPFQVKKILFPFHSRVFFSTALNKISLPGMLAVKLLILKQKKVMGVNKVNPVLFVGNVCIFWDVNLLKLLGLVYSNITLLS
jgi:hypothetical protein